MQVGDTMAHASALGSTFEGRIVAETTVGDRTAIVPAIRGSAWITGVTRLTVDGRPASRRGTCSLDTWGVSGLDTQA